MVKSNKTRNISIIWDFDKTLTPMDSTTELINTFLEPQHRAGFWSLVKKISGVQSNKLEESISTSEAPVWMHFLSEIATVDNESKDYISLDKESLKKIIAHKIKFYPEVLGFFAMIKNLSEKDLYRHNKIQIHHFIITAGLEKLVTAVFELHDSSDLVTKIFGCKYHVFKYGKNEEIIKNIPIYCMDKTTKTRALFEICKGCFLPDAKYTVDDLVPKEKEWCPFENMIYIGDGDTDIPAFSLIKSRKGMSVGVFDPALSEDKRSAKAHNMKKGERLDLFTPANFERSGELFQFIKMRCQQIVKRYETYVS